MPSRPHDTGWDFGCVLDLIDSDPQAIGTTRLLPRTQTAVPSSVDTNHDTEGGKRLGSFSKLWQQLGVPDDVPLPAIAAIEPESEDQTDSDNCFPLLAELKKDVAVVDDYDVNASCSLDASPLEDKLDEDPFIGMNKKQRSKARKRSEKERKENISLEQHQQSEREKDDLQARLAVPVKNEPKRKQSITKREQLRSNVGAKMRPVTPPPKSLNFGKQAKSPNKKHISLLDVPGATKSIKSTIQPTCTPTQPKSPDTVSTVLSRPHGIAPGHNLGTTNARNTAVGTPARHQSQFPFPQSNGNGHVQALVSTSSSARLVPRTVQPVTIPRTNQSQITPHMFQPQMMPGMTQAPMTPQMAQYLMMAQPPTGLRTPQLSCTPGRQPKFLNIRRRVERHFHFLQQLMHNFPEDVPWLLSPMQMCNEKTSAEGIHVFVDASNIMIGFRDTLREYRAQGYEMSFDSLVLLMERRRPVAKRVYAGSHRESAPLPHVTKLVETSKAIGYESNVNEQVLISRENSDKKKFFRAVKQFGWIKAAQLHSGSGDSDSEMDAAPTTPSAPRWVEQGVDEILHLKMCQSIIDTEIPSTMVLATGDGAEAEHSDGFLAHVERALKKGWKVELVSWKQQINGGYKSKKFRARWGEQFKIFHLDSYIESLIETE